MLSTERLDVSSPGGAHAAPAACASVALATSPGAEVEPRPIAPGRRRLSRRACVELELARDAQAPGAARAAASELCAHTDMSEACRYTLLLLVSELVTNAVLHSNARPARPVSFAAHALAQEIRVEVGDGGSGFTREDAARARGGWGLRLVDKEARSWGVEHARGTRVWFELALA